ATVLTILIDTHITPHVEAYLGAQAGTTSGRTTTISVAPAIFIAPKALVQPLGIILLGGAIHVSAISDSVATTTAKNTGTSVLHAGQLQATGRVDGATSAYVGGNIQ